MNKKGKIITWSIVLVLIVAVIVVITTQLMNGGAKKIDRTQFKEYIENAQYYNSDGSLNLNDGEGNPDTDKIGQLTANGYTVEGGKILNSKGEEVTLTVIWKVEVDGYEYTGYTKNSNGKYVRAYYCYGPSAYGTDGWDSETFGRWESLGVSIEMGNPNSGSWVSTAFTILTIVIMCVVFFLILRSSMGGAGKVMSFAKTKARISTNIKVRFSDVAGAEEEKVELAEIVEFLKQPKKFSDLGAKIPKGVLLIGPPGTGKTLFAKAIAGEAGVPFFSVSGLRFR